MGGFARSPITPPVVCAKRSKDGGAASEASHVSRGTRTRGVETLGTYVIKKGVGRDPGSAGKVRRVC